MLGGPVGANFNCMLRIDLESGRLDMLALPEGAGISEPAHVAAEDPEHGGWLLNVVDIPGPTPDPADYLSELWITEADNLGKGPIAKIKTGMALRSQVHGTWVSRDTLEASAEK